MLDIIGINEASQAAFDIESRQHVLCKGAGVKSDKNIRRDAAPAINGALLVPQGGIGWPGMDRRGVAVQYFPVVKTL